MNFHVARENFFILERNIDEFLVLEHEVRQRRYVDAGVAFARQVDLRALILRVEPDEMVERLQVGESRLCDCWKITSFKSDNNSGDSYKWFKQKQKNQ